MNKMSWTKEKPTEEGFYGYFDPPPEAVTPASVVVPSIVKVYISHSYYSEKEHTVKDELRAIQALGFMHESVEKLNGYWCGPFILPEVPKELMKIGVQDASVTQC